MPRGNLLQYLIKRAFYSILVLISVTLLTHLFIQFAPGDPVDLLLGRARGNEALKQQVRQQYHLDEPWHIQYLLWLRDVLNFDLGVSVTKSRPVTALIAERWVISAQLVIISMLFAVFLSIPAGIYAGYKYGSKLDKAVTVFAILGVSMPVFVTSVLSILVFSYYIPILPTVEAGAGFFERIPALIMPSFLLAIWIGSLMFRMMRAGMRDVLEKDYMQTSVAMGIPTRKRIIKHAAKNALAPVMTISALWAGSLIVATIIVEYVFGIGGLGLLIVNSVLANDFPVVLAGVVITATVFVVLNFIIDILYTWVDPRVALGERN